ncbi:major capsid protein [bacterium]|nr:major capsid protein [bacterium]
MPLLTPSAVHVDQPLTNLTLAYAQSQENFIADKVFPTVGVQKQSDKYYLYDRANMNRTGDVEKLAPRTEVNRIGMTISNSSYFADVYGLGMDFDEQTLANEDAALEIRSAGAETLAMRLMIHREEQFATSFFSDNIWGTNYDGAGATAGTNFLYWDDAAAKPIQNVTDLRRVMQLKSGGFKPNTMVVGKEVRDALVNNADILARLNGGATVTNTALVTDAKLAEIFEVENFYVMEAVKNSSVEGVAESNAFIGGKHAMLCYTPNNAGLMSPAAGLTFAWNNLEGVNNLGITVESFSDDALKRQQIAEMIQVKMSYDMKIVGADLGAFVNNIVQ